MLGVKYTVFDQVDSLMSFVLVSILLWIIMTILYASIIDRGDRKFIIRFVEKKLKIK